MLILFFDITSLNFALLCFNDILSVAGNAEDSILPTSGRIYFLSGDISGTITINIFPLDFRQGFKVLVV